MTVITFFLILFILVIVHEFGHFIVAKLFKIRVDEFAFGFPPRIGSIVRGETRYAFNALPIGGYVKIYGENPDDVKDDVDRQRSFMAKSRLIQALVIVAGVVFNVVLAWLLIATTLMLGVQVSADHEAMTHVRDVRLVATHVEPNSPAEAGGMRPGDKLVSLGDGVTIVSADSPEVVTNFVRSRAMVPLALRAERDGEIVALTVVPMEGIVPDRPAIGIHMDMIGVMQLPPHLALIEGAKRTMLYIKLTASGLWGFFSGIFLGSADLSEVTGPVGLVDAVGDAADLGVVHLLLFTAIISINLALLNIVPFPALDGGRLLFILIEVVTRRPIPVRIANWMNIGGFTLLMLLMVIVTWNDVTKLF